jgi:hypothetical protein
VVNKRCQRRFADTPQTGQHQGGGAWLDQPRIDGLYDLFALLDGAGMSGRRQALNATVCRFPSRGLLLIRKWLWRAVSRPGTLLFREQSQFFSAFAKEFDESLLKIGAGTRDALFPATDRLGIAADPAGDIRLGPAAPLTFMSQVVRPEQMVVHVDLFRSHLLDRDAVHNRS